MYVTGGIGSTVIGESFTLDYDLPNDTKYCETCAAIGLVFFYVYPLEVVPLKSRKDPTKSHVKPVRPQWLGCACCPPNLARMVISVEDYIYTVKDNIVYTNLYMQSEAEIEGLQIIQTTGYPYEEKMKCGSG